MSLIKRFPSYDQIVRGAVSTAIRFPFTLLSAALGVTVAMMLVGPGWSDDPGILQRLLVCAALGLPLFTALTVLAEKRKCSGGRRLLIQLVGLALLVVYFFTIPNKLAEPMHHLIRFALLFIGLHFLTAWLPWTGRDQLTGFWQYNKTLFLRFLLSGLYSAVLFLGLALALAAIDNLFGADIGDRAYLRLWILIAGLFQTWVFLAGVPKDLDALNQSREYPGGLKVFTQFILLPLVGLYFAILIAYEAKIVVTWNWPKGWVSELVLWYSVVGILSLLLLHPLRDQIENKWIRAISKWYYLALVPLVVMLFLAIMRRIRDYGVTEMRYFVFALAVGLAIVMIYMIASKRKDVRLIPIVICLLAFFSAYGPWSAFAVSRSSQLARLEGLLLQNEILVDGVVRPGPASLSLDDRREMSSAVAYLNEHHGMSAFSSWIADSTRQRLDTLPVYGRTEAITQELGFAYVYPGRWGDEGEWMHLAREQGESVEISGYDLMFSFDALNEYSPVRNFAVGEDTCRLELDTVGNTLKVLQTGPGAVSEAAMVIELGRDLTALMKSAEKEKFSAEDLTFVAAGDGAAVKIVLDWVNGRRVDDGMDISGMSGMIFLRRPE